MNGVDCEAETIKPNLFPSFILFVFSSIKKILFLSPPNDNENSIGRFVQTKI